MASILFGTHTYQASGDAARRQDAGAASLRDLRGVQLVNVQFADAPHDIAGIPTLPVLRRDSSSVTRRPGPRKPLVFDIFDALWREAARRGSASFAFSNADILISQAAVDLIASGDRDAYIFAREDFDGVTGHSGGIALYGADVFAIATAWWARHRRRFRAYILGEAVWDNVYAAVLLCHARALLENRRGLVRHEAHAQNWKTDGPFADYHRLLAAYDATYFSLWCEYVTPLVEMRRRGTSSLEAEDALLRRTFRWPPPLGARLVQAARGVKAFFRYRAAALQSR